MLSRRETISGVAACAAMGAAGTAMARTAKPPAIDPAKVLFLEGADQLYAYRNMDKLYPTRSIRAPAAAKPWPRAAAALDIRYTYNGKTWDTGSFMADNRVTAMVIVRDGHIALERYGLGNDENTLWTSFSVAKSLTSTLIGAAIKDGYIGGVDDPVTKYLPVLKGAGWDGCIIRDLLRMSSGVKWNEDYLDPTSDDNKMNYLVARRSKVDRLLPFLASLKRAAPPGQIFAYKTGEATILGYLVHAAIGRPLADYASEKIWKPCGFEHDGYWVLTSEGGVEWGGACFSATARDYARFGQFILDNGKAGGVQILPQWWVAEACQASAPAGANGPSGYGYLWWMGPAPGFRARGVFGQQIYINPEKRLVLAVHSAWPKPRPEKNFAALDAYINAVNAAV